MRSNRAIDLKGQKFGRLTVLRDSGQRTNGKIMWVCRCICGDTVNVRSSHLIGGQIQSCKCLNRERTSEVNTTHGRSRDRLYAVYRAMLQRCSDKTCSNWERYGGRGIRVCKRWQGLGGFERFISDMKEPPTVNHSIERKKNKLDYSPSNCVWATRSTQARNKRNNRFVSYQGQRKLLLDWAAVLKLPYKELHRRIVSRGWPVDRAFTTPVRKIK